LPQDCPDLVTVPGKRLSTARLGQPSVLSLNKSNLKPTAIFTIAAMPATVVSFGWVSQQFLSIFFSVSDEETVHSVK